MTRLLFEGTRTVGVEYLHEGTLHQVGVNEEVILSAGAFDSPKLLMLSGIGDAAHLQALGISVVADLPTCRAIGRSDLTSDPLARRCTIQSALAKWVLTQWQ